MEVLVLYGGRSAEREISLESARFVAQALGSAGYGVVPAEIGPDGSWTIEGEEVRLEAGPVPWRLTRRGRRVIFDVVFPVLHGPLGEDGTVQGLCETAGWRCAGAGVAASAVGIDKILFKRLVSGAGVPVVPWVEVCASCRPSPDAISCALGLPVFVKPARLGSSVGISKVESADGLEEALALALSYDERVLVEQAVADAREIEVSVMGDGIRVHSSLPGEIRPGREWYDYEAKYACPDSRLLIPADLPGDLVRAVRSHAESAMVLLGSRGFARVDFLLGRDLYLNEINTIPGFTPISMFPKLWEASGLSVASLLEAILSEAVSRQPVGLWKG
jgi:D-alanine-D-alanine ligase